VYHVLKSGVKEALQDLLDTLPSFDKPFDSFFHNAPPFSENQEQSAILTIFR